jgi:hypothetical protein
MQPPFDIFRVEPDGLPMWLETSASVEAAKVRIAELGGHLPGEYLIMNLQTGNRITVRAGKSATNENR